MSGLMLALMAARHLRRVLGTRFVERCSPCVSVLLEMAVMCGIRHKRRPTLSGHWSSISSMTRPHFQLFPGSHSLPSFEQAGASVMLVQG